MIQAILDFLGIDYTFTVTDELMESILPVLICISSVLTLYLFICFFQFLQKLLNRK